MTAATPTPYSPYRHERALAQHDRRWYEMRAARRMYGADSEEYRDAHQAMIEAKRIVVWEGRKRKRWRT